MPVLGLPLSMSMRRVIAAGLTAVQIAVVASALSACKGGGGGSSAPPAGSFTLSASSLTFSANFTGAPAAPQSVLMTISGSGVAAVGAGYAQGVVPPSWLTVTATGSGTQYSFAFFANTTNLAPGTYTATVTLGTGDANGNILQTRDVQVTYTIRDGVRIPMASPVLTGVAGSSQSSQTFQVNVVAPAGVQWQPSSSQPWLQPQSGTRTGSFSLMVTVDTSTLPPGQSTATLTVTNTADSTDTATLLFTVNLSPPVLTTTLSQITLGGDSGLDTSPVSLGFALGTGTNAYPWTLTATTTSGGNWLTTSSTAGTVASSNVTVTVNANRSGLAAGTYTGELELRATVPGAIVTRTIPVTLKLDANRLLVSDLGVAFSSFPSRQVLTRTLAVRDTRGETGVPWQATSSETWLQATLTGGTGDPLVLTAVPGALAPGQYLASVTVVSPNAAIGNTETIRVGLTVSATDPLPLIHLPTVNAFAAVVPSPVKSEVFVLNYINASQMNLEVYDIYSGALLRTLLTTDPATAALTISDDGASLYVSQELFANDRVVELDPTTGAELGTFQLNGNVLGLALVPTVYARPDTHPVLITPYTGQIFDAATRAPFTAALDTNFPIDRAFAVSSDQRYVYAVNNGRSPATVYRYEFRYSALSAAGLSVVTLVEQRGTTEPYWADNGQDIAISSSDAIVYLAAGSPYQFDTLAPDTLLRTGFLPGDAYPNNVETCWNGLVAGGAMTDAPDGDIWVYDSTGALVERLDSSYSPSGLDDNLSARMLKFSGDCTRLVSASGLGLRIQAAPPAP